MPASCMSAMTARLWVAVGLNPGKPGVWVNGSASVFPFSSTRLPFASVTAFSSTMFAVEKSPTVQPARVNGTHGAGVTPPPAYAIDGDVSTVFATAGFVFVSMIGEVQYVNDVAGSVDPSGLYVLYEFVSGCPCRSPYRPV